MTRMNRRQFLRNTGAAMAAGGVGRVRGAEAPGAGRRVIAITGGDRQHWFGYYDKWQVDPGGRFALAGEVGTFFRSPTPGDVLRVGLVDLQNGNAWKEIGRSTSWGWQQGCMLQWVPGSSSEVIWNDHGDDGFVSRVCNIATGEVRTLPRAVYTLSPRGDFALCVDFDRLQFFRPGYGYPAKDPVASWPKAPDDTGIYRMDLKTGASQLILSFAQIARLPRPLGSVADHFHWFNHLLINPSGTRFIFLNRSRPVGSDAEMGAWLENEDNRKAMGFSGRYVTRALTADVDGGNVHALNDSGSFSHFIWKGNDAICAWAVPEGGKEAAFFDFQDLGKGHAQVGKGVMVRNGHNTYVPNTNNEWILNDTYPMGKERLQELYLFHVPSGRKVTLGRFHEPARFAGEWRCDLHPRCNQQGTRVFFDSTHEGGRRQIYAVEIGDIVS